MIPFHWFAFETGKNSFFVSIIRSAFFSISTFTLREPVHHVPPYPPKTNENEKNLKMFLASFDVFYWFHSNSDSVQSLWTGTFRGME